MKIRTALTLLRDLGGLRGVLRHYLGEPVGQLQVGDVVLMSDAAEALAELRKGGFSVLVTDTNMPDMDGIALLKAVREDPKLATLPVIVLFTHLQGSNMDKHDVMAMGATAVLKKTEFLQCYDQVLRRWLG